MSEGVSGNTTRADTRNEIILAAEKLFAKEGISNVALRRITRAAGQRNESAIHYHFGSREGVVAAIMDLRTVPIDTERRRMLGEFRLRANGAPISSRDVAKALVRPLGAYLEAEGGQSHYLRFIGLLFMDRPMWRKFENRTQDQGLIEARAALHSGKPHLPEMLVRHRFSLSIQMASYAMARMEQAADDLGPRWLWSHAEAQLCNLIDSVQAVYDAPLSPETVQAHIKVGVFSDRS